MSAPVSTPPPEVALEPQATPHGAAEANRAFMEWERSGEIDWYRSAMQTRLSFWVRLLLVPLFARVRFDDKAAATIRNAAAKGTPVYIMRTVSLLEYLYFNYAFLQRGLPLARFANEVYAALFGPFRRALRTLISKFLQFIDEGRLPNPVDSGHLTALVAAGQPTLLFLRRPDTLLRRLNVWRAPQADVMGALIEAQRQSEVPIYLIPQLILWTRKPDPKRKTFFEVLFGDREGPGPIRRLGRFVLNAHQSFVVVGEPVDLKQFIAEHGAGRSDEKLARMLRHMMRRYLYREKQVVQGPNVRPRRLVLERVMRDNEVIATLARVAEQEGKTPEELEKRVRRYLARISADLSMSVIDLLDYVFRRVFTRIYDGIVVDDAELERLRTVSRDATLVYVPCHRSHVDYLLLSYVLYNHQLAVPHIAAGINLSFWPLGPIFRRAGAFFVQRSFKNDQISPVVLKKYLWSLLIEEYCLEFFIEGGRSRSGKFLQPKLGMLAMVLDYVAERPRPRDVVLVPVSIAYERVVEVKSYVRELEGGEKQPENLRQVIGSGRALRNRYGKVYVGFLEPISLREYLGALPVPYRAEQPWAEKKAVLEPLGLRILDHIARAMPLTATELVATAILNHRRRGILEGELWARVERLEALFEGVGMRATIDGRADIEEALALFAREKFVVEYVDSERRIFAINEERRLGLDYFKNAALTPLVPEAMLACALVRPASGPIDAGELETRFRFLLELWQDEFIFDAELGPGGYFTRAVEHLVRMGMLIEVGTGEVGRLELNPAARLQLEELEGLLHPFLEAYYVALRTVAVLSRERIRERELTKRVLEQAAAMYMTEELQRKEATSHITLKNALRRFRDLGIVQVTTSSAGEDGRNDPLLVLDEARWQETYERLRTIAVRDPAS